MSTITASPDRAARTRIPLQRHSQFRWPFKFQTRAVDEDGNATVTPYDATGSTWVAQLKTDAKTDVVIGTIPVVIDAVNPFAAALELTAVEVDGLPCCIEVFLTETNSSDEPTLWLIGALDFDDE